MVTDELWHLVEARRDDGVSAMFRIRDVAPRADQPNIFVVELPYPVTALSRLPDAAAYRRLSAFEEQFVLPAAKALDWTFVAAKTEDGSFFLYLYGAGEPGPMIERLSPFDGALGFFDEKDPTWDEYAALRELLAEAAHMARPETAAELAAEADAKTTAKLATTPSKSKPKAKAEAKSVAKVKAKPAAKVKAKPAAKKQPAAKTKPAAKKQPAAKTKPAAKKQPAAKTKPAAKSKRR